MNWRACEVLNMGRKSFQQWVNKHHPSLSDDLWGQYWLAAVAAGLNFCNKARLSTEERLAGLIYASVHLKRYFAQFGIPLPVDVRLLYDANRSDHQSQKKPLNDDAAPINTLKSSLHNLQYLERVEYDDAVLRLRSMLMEAELNSICIEGRALSMEQAIKFALI